MSMTMDEAVRQLRDDPRYAEHIYDSYLSDDILECAERFWGSAEFTEVKKIIADLCSGTILDLGAGTGIASYAFAKSGAELVYALEPDSSDLVGRGAIRHLASGLPIEVIDAYGEMIPLPDKVVDVVYARQVLHHVRDLSRVLSEVVRVLKRGGTFLACREHVVDDDRQLEVFRENHLLHRLVGGESAFPLNEYLEAIHSAGLNLRQVFAPWHTVINAFPAVRTMEELKRYPEILLQQRFGIVGAWAGHLPPVRAWVWKRNNRPKPGRMYSFWAIKP